jgi:hypothetical protein
MTLDEILAELNKLDRTQVVAGLQANSQPIYQAIYDKGTGFAVAKHTAEKADLEGKITGLTSQVTEKDQQITQLSAKTPEVATLRTQYEGQINQLKETHKNELKARDQALIGERRSRALSDLRTKLVGGGVDADYADVLTNKSTTTARFRFDDKTGKMDILAADSEVPIAVATGKDVLDVLAEELKTGVPAKFVMSNGDGGSGTNGTGGKGKGGDLYEEIRTEAKSKSEAKKAPSARERLGML